MIAVSRTNAAIELLRRAVEKERAAIDSRDDLRAISLLVRFDRQTGRPFIADLRSTYETS
jgi:hypothetical protein